MCFCIQGFTVPPSASWVYLACVCSHLYLSLLLNCLDFSLFNLSLIHVRGFQKHIFLQEGFVESGPKLTQTICCSEYPLSCPNHKEVSPSCPSESPTDPSQLAFPAGTQHCCLGLLGFALQERGVKLHLSISAGLKNCSENLTLHYQGRSAAAQLLYF